MPEAIFASVTAAFAILGLVIALALIEGRSAVPLKSPANFILPFVVASASAKVPEPPPDPPPAAIASST